MLESFNSGKFEYKRLTEEEQKARGILGRLKGIIADTKNSTRNGRKYSSSLWENVFNNDIMKEKIANRCCFGELGHPTDREETDMEKIAICLAEQPKVGDDGKIYGVFDILSTPNGRILKSLCDYGCNIGVSSRGTGDLYTDVDGNEAVDPDTYNCEAWDAVLIPAVKEARLDYVTESLDKKRYNKSLRTVLQESLSKASIEDKKVMTETLDILGISLEPTQGQDCIMQTATNVMNAYQCANKWLDIVKEIVYTNLGCVFFSSYIHDLAHTMPVRFDKFGDILHTVNMRIPYPETPYIPNEPTSIDEVFGSLFMCLDNIKIALNEFIKCTDETAHGMACAAETLLNDIESEYPAIFRMQQEWQNSNGDMATFDKYVGQYVEHKDELNESLKEGIFDREDNYKDWEPADVELHKNTDWKARNYDELEVPEDSFEDDVVMYRHNAEPEYKTVKFTKRIRPNNIFPPYYAPAENPFEGSVGCMYDGKSHGKYDIHNRYEDQETYDRLSESRESVDEAFEALWYDSPDDENYKTKEFKSYKAMVKFYKAHKDDEDKFNWWLTRRNADWEVIDDYDVDDIDESLEEIDPDTQDYYKQELAKLYDDLLNLAKEADYDGARKLSDLLQRVMDEVDLDNKEINEELSYEEAKAYFKKKGIELTKDVYNLILQINNKPNDMEQESLNEGVKDTIKIISEVKSNFEELLNKYNQYYPADENGNIPEEIEELEKAILFGLEDANDSIVFGESKECNGENCSDKEDKEVVNDKSEKELVAEFQESLKTNKKLDEDNLSLKEQLSVCIAKEKELQEQLAKYKKAAASLSDTAKEVKPLKESLDKKDNIIENGNQRISNLTESLKKKSSALDELTESKEQLSAQVKSLNESLENISKQLENSKQLVEKYRKSYAAIKENLLEAKATAYGIKEEDLKKNLTESYKIKDIDSTCEKLVEQRNRLDKLPIRLGENTKINFSNTSESLVERLNKNDDDYVSDLLKSMID